MRIGYLLSRYPFPRHGYITQEIEALRAQGLEIEIASIRRDIRPPESLNPSERREASQTFYVFDDLWNFAWRNIALMFRRPRGYARAFRCALKYGRHQPKRTLLGIAYLTEAAAIGAHFRSRGIRHVHSHYSSTVAWMLGALFDDIAISMSIHGSAEFMGPFCLEEKVECSAFVRVISECGRDALKKASAERDWSKIHLLRLGIEPKQYLPVEFRDQPSRFEILFVGGTEPPRAVDDLLIALNRVSNRVEFRFHLIGDGANRSDLEALAQRLGIGGRVIFHGWKNQNDVRIFPADIFVLSSRAEGIPVALMEAMCRELPCIASDVGGVSELIEHDVSGLLVAPEDPEALSDAIVRLANDSIVRRRIGKAARQKILREYDSAKNTNQLAVLFKKSPRFNGIMEKDIPVNQ